MTTMTTLPFGRPLTRTDLEGLPEDDGHRYELIDGVLIVSPAPRHVHQVIVGNLHLLLRQACPAELQVIFAPFAVALADDTEIQPDLLVAPRTQFRERELDGGPLLAIEVLTAEVPSYWLVDPEGPTLTVLELQDGTYVEMARGQADDELTVCAPFAMAIRPSDLLR